MHGKRPLNKLSAAFASSHKEPGRHGDGGGLYLVIRPGGSRSWTFLYKKAGRVREMGLGVFDAKGEIGLTLAAAREKAAQARILLRAGSDPILAKRSIPQSPEVETTFGLFADQYLESIKAGFKHPRTAIDWKRNLEVHAKSLRVIPIDSVTTDDVLSVIRPLWSVKHKTARELRGKIEQVLDAAKAKGKRTGENPARWKGHLDVFFKDGKRRKKNHHPAARYDEMPGIVNAVRRKHLTALTCVNLALEFTILTAVRTNEAREMRAREVDLSKAEWRIPGIRMKMDEDHIVPLSLRALEIIKIQVGEDAAPDDYVFKGLKPNQPLGMNAVLHALKAVTTNATTHGCRSTFRDWVGDCTDFPREIAEAALAHAVGNEVEQAYRRGRALEKRRLLMTVWSQFLELSDASV